MAFLKREQIKKIVEKALSKVADFTGDIEVYEFKHFHEFHKTMFLAKLKEYIIKEPYYYSSGDKTDERYYDVSLSVSILNTWQTMLDCIVYVEEYHTVKNRNPNKIQLS